MYQAQRPFEEVAAEYDIRNEPGNGTITPRRLLKNAAWGENEVGGTKVPCIRASHFSILTSHLRLLPPSQDVDDAVVGQLRA
jgi:hypothetical protein